MDTMSPLGSAPADTPLAAEVEALIPLAVDAFMKDALVGAARVLADADNPLRLNLFSAAVRMLFEHVMGTLAPDAEVMACDWFKLENDQTKPTRRQRVQYWLQGGLTDAFLIGALHIDPAPLRAQVVEAFNTLSKHVHGREDTIVYGVAAQDAAAREIIDALKVLLNTYHDCRLELIEPLAESLDDEAVNALMSETIGAVDELATHHSIEEVYTEETEVVSIGAYFVRYKATGTISVALQWGSDSDVSRGDGAEMDQSFPFECEFEVPIDDPRDLSNATVTSGVDTSHWYEGRYDED